MAPTSSPRPPTPLIVAQAPIDLPSFDWKQLLQTVQTEERKANRWFLSLPPSQQAGLTIAGTGAGTLALLYGYKRFWRRIRNADHVLPNMLTGKKWIKGRVTSVGDSDNFRVYHTPGIFFNWPFKIRFIPTEKKALQNETIHIRIAGVDAPEAAHFGRPAQPLSAEALEFLRGKVLGRKVKVLLSSKDQYGRIVGLPLLPRRFLPFLPSEILPLSILKAGFGEVYTSGGAEYSYVGIEKFQKAEEEARRKKRGIWGLGKKMESPSEYKRRMKENPPSPNETRAESAKAADQTGTTMGRKGFFGRLFGR
ncbi:hypothetical protein BDY24DRAFT_395771 [Mrakia frigida]|uniref:Lcl3p n=1 Tax=Mrakia frigida TaxID=29902 RepID=UPI003FCC1CDA